MLERVDCKRGDHANPLGIIDALDEFRELEVGLEAREQPAELVVVVMHR